MHCQFGHKFSFQNYCRLEAFVPFPHAEASQKGNLRHTTISLFSVSSLSKRIPSLYSSQKTPSNTWKQSVWFPLQTPQRAASGSGVVSAWAATPSGQESKVLTARQFQAGSWGPRATPSISPLHRRTTAPLCPCKDRKPVIYLGTKADTVCFSRHTPIPLFFCF